MLRIAFALRKYRFANKEQFVPPPFLPSLLKQCTARIVSTFLTKNDKFAYIFNIRALDSKKKINFWRKGETTKEIFSTKLRKKI